VVGAGGREHTIAWKLAQSPDITQIYCIPGNGGTVGVPKCVNVSLTLDDYVGIVRLAEVQGVGLVVIGPEMPLAGGLSDLLHKAGIPVFGPTQMGAQIESSKAWAKELMRSKGIPTAEFVVFRDSSSAKDYVSSRSTPIVIKADGLASGKGVTVAETIPEAWQAIEQVFLQHQQVVIEEFLAGRELSVLAVTDGYTIRPLLPACDRKRIGEGDTGANTGGMGAYSPSAWVTPELMAKIQTTILEPTLEALRDRGIIYRGCLYAGLMITPTGEPKVIEFNCRFGDPETQVIVPLLKTPLEQILVACVEGRLQQLPPIEWYDQSAVCVILASRGYPDKPETGHMISGIGKAESLGAVVFHSGTRLRNNQLITSGGRVLGVTALGNDLASAQRLAYEAVAQIQFDGMYFRRDIVPLSL
jgi:phosphoribosylamine--glycine ligase